MPWRAASSSRRARMGSSWACWIKVVSWGGPAACLASRASLALAHLLAGGPELPLPLGQGLLGLGQTAGQVGLLRPAGEQASRPLDGAAGHGAPGAEDLPLQGDHGEAVPPGPGQGPRRGPGGPPPPSGPTEPGQRGGGGDRSPPGRQPPPGKPGSCSSPSSRSWAGRRAVRGRQVTRPPSLCLTRRRTALPAASSSTRRFCMAPPGRSPGPRCKGRPRGTAPPRADDPPQGSLPGGRHGGFHPFGIAFVVAGHLPQGPGPGGQGAFLGLEGHPGLFRLGGLPAEGSQGLPVGFQSTLPGQGLVPALGLGGLQGLLGRRTASWRAASRCFSWVRLGLLAGDVPLQLLPRCWCWSRSAWACWAAAWLDRIRSRSRSMRWRRSRRWVSFCWIWARRVSPRASCSWSWARRLSPWV